MSFQNAVVQAVMRFSLVLKYKVSEASCLHQQGRWWWQQYHPKRRNTFTRQHDVVCHETWATAARTQNTVEPRLQNVKWKMARAGQQLLGFVSGKYRHRRIFDHILTYLCVWWFGPRESVHCRRLWIFAFLQHTTKSLNTRPESVKQTN